MPWSTKFEIPFDLPDGRQLLTLKDAANNIMKLPKKEPDLPEWQAAIEALMLCSRGGHAMLARIGVMKALNRNVERVFNSDAKLSAPPLHLRFGEVPIPTVDGLELAAINGNARRREKAYLTAEFDKARTDLAQRQAAEVRNRLVIRREPAQQPHNLDIASGFSFQPPARLNPIQISIDIKLQEDRRMIRRPTSCRRVHPSETHFGQIERINKYVNHADRVTSVNEIIEAFGQERRLSTIRLFNEAPHQPPP